MLSADHVRVRRDGDRAVLTVADTGMGIEAEHLPHVFERFYRIDPARAKAIGGSGLGLAISRGIVEAHGGTIELASTPGMGTVATVRLPAAAISVDAGGATGNICTLKSEVVGS